MASKINVLNQCMNALGRTNLTYAFAEPDEDFEDAFVFVNSRTSAFYIVESPTDYGVVIGYANRYVKADNVFQFPESFEEYQAMEDLRSSEDHPVFHMTKHVSVFECVDVVKLKKIITDFAKELDKEILTSLSSDNPIAAGPSLIPDCLCPHCAMMANL